MKTSKIFDKIINYFILYMPLLDLITSIMTYNGLAVSAGLIIKTGLLAIVYFYLLFSKKVPKREKIVIVLFSLFVGCVLLNNIKLIIAIKSLDFLKFLIKYAYLIIITIFFIHYFKQNKIDVIDLKIPIKIILLSIFIATITGTAMPSYSNGHRLGIEGWFYSANELGSLLTLLYPISIYLFFHHDKSKKIEYVYVIIHAVALLLLGTKVGLLSFFIITIIYFIYRIIMIKKDFTKSSLILMALILLSASCLWKQLPSVVNSSDKYNALITMNDNKGEQKKDNLNEMIYSGRNQYVENIKNIKQNTAQKKETSQLINNMVGYMYLTNNSFILTERDFHDAYLFLGIIGFGFVLLILIMPFIINFKEIIKNLFDIKIDMLTLGLGVTCGCAFISGHTLLSPMVSFYISIVIGLIANYKKEIKSNKKEILISTVHMDFGGIETTLLNLLKNIDYNKMNIDLCLLLEGPLKERVSKKVNVFTPYDSILKRIINSDNKICKVIKHLIYNKYTAFLWATNKKYDVAIDYCGYYKFITHYVVNSRARRKIIWIHSQPKYILDDKKIKKYKWFDKIVLVSDSSKNEMIKLYPQFKHKCDVMWNLLEIPKEDSEIIEWKQNRIKIISIGRLCEAKRFDKLIQIGKKMKKEVDIKIVGDGELKETLFQQIHSNNLQDCVELIGKKNNVGNYLKSADLYVITSEYEGLPTVVLEALSYNLPIIGLRIPPLEEIQQKIAPKGTITLVNELDDFVEAVKNHKKKKTKSLEIAEYNLNNIKKFEELIQ